jgi:hypothetical protein
MSSLGWVWSGGFKMTDEIGDRSSKAGEPENPAESQDASLQARRPVLKRLGRFAAVTAPAVTLLLAARTKPSLAASPSFAPP